MHNIRLFLWRLHRRIFRARIERAWREMADKCEAHDEKLFREAFESYPDLLPLRDAIKNIPDDVGVLRWMDARAAELGLEAEWNGLLNAMWFDSGATMSFFIAHLSRKLNEGESQCKVKSFD